jgi:hypothetical protein
LSKERLEIAIASWIGPFNFAGALSDALSEGMAALKVASTAGGHDTTSATV